jgi:hypothetical protein
VVGYQGDGTWINQQLQRLVNNRVYTGMNTLVNMAGNDGMPRALCKVVNTW